MTKTELRARLRALHPGQEERDLQSTLICRHILQSNEYRSASVIGAYVPLLREADIMPVLLDALACGKDLVLPRCQHPPEMTLHRVTDLCSLVSGPYGLMEPDGDLPAVEPGEMDLLIVPLEGIDLHGMRLGKGGGYYDALLSKADVPTMGVALSNQWTAHVPADPWDKPLRACADAHGIRRFK